MNTPLRESGSELLGQVPWGTRVCQFYESQKDLRDILVPYFAAGLKNNEFCMWITSAPLEHAEAERALSEALPGFARYKRRGQIEILPYDKWYSRSGRFDAKKALDKWLQKEAWALANGYDGLRVSSNTSWLDDNNRSAYLNYERAVDSAACWHRMLIFSTYFLEKLSLPDIVEVLDTHQIALIRNQGAWRKIAAGRRRAEEELKLDNEISNNLTEGVTIVGLDDGLIKYANPRFEKMFGYDAGELVGKDISLINAPAEKTPEAKRTEVLDILKRTGKWHGEIENIKKDGARFWCYANVSIFDHSRFGRVCISVHTDITGRKLAEKAVIASEVKYRTLFELAHDSILLLEISLTGEPVIREANTAALKAFGYPREEIVGKPVSILNENAGEAYLIHKKVGRLQAENGNIFELRHKRKDGSVFTAEVSTWKMIINGKHMAISIERDITERKMMEEALKLGSEIFKNMAEGVFILGLDDGIIKHANPQFERMFGYETGELTGKDVSIINAPGAKSPEETKRELLAIQRRTGEWHGDIENIKKDGTRFWCHADNSVFVHDKFGRVCVSVRSNITERKRAEEALKKAFLELEADKKLLEDKNTAFREVINEIEIEKNKLKDEIIINVNELILPIVHRIRQMGGAPRKHLDLLEKSLGALVSSFGRRLTEKNLKLTPKELEISNMVKSGLTTKEIAGLLNASPLTINKHRNNIRKKLDLANKGINLISFLQSL